MRYKPIYLLLMPLICLVAYACGDNPGVDSTKLKEIERLWQSVPVHPGMVEVKGSSSSGREVTKKYRSTAQFADVKGFYMEKLPRAGWKFVQDKELKHYGIFKGERLLAFRQGEYQLNVKFNGDRKAELVSDYLMSVGLPE